MACISIIGSIDTLLRINRISKFQLICSLVFHLGIFYFLGNYDNSKVHAKINSLNIYEYIRLNTSKISIYLLVVALTIIIFLPWWPYDLPRNELFILYILIYYLYDLVNNNMNK